MTVRAAAPPVDEVLGALGYGGLIVVGHRSGTQSRVARVVATAPDGESVGLAVKAFRADAGLGAPDQVAREALALERFGRALATGGSGTWVGEVTCPQVVVSLPEQGVLVTTWQAGVALDDVLLGADVHERRRLAGLVLDGLAAFHAACREPYGDAHPGNVLVDGRRVVLLDPTAADPRHRAIQAGVPALAADLGYWLHSATSQALGQAARGQLRLASTRLRFAVELLRVAEATSTDAQGLQRDVTTVARRHHERIPAAGRGRAVRAVGCALVAAIERRPSREVGRV